MRRQLDLMRSTKDLYKVYDVDKLHVSKVVSAGTMLQTNVILRTGIYTYISRYIYDGALDI